MIKLNKRFVFWLAPGIVAFSLVLAGCQKKEEPAPAGNASAGAGPAAIGPAAGDAGSGNSPAAEGTKPAEKQGAGTKTF